MQWHQASRELQVAALVVVGALLEVSGWAGVRAWLAMTVEAGVGQGGGRRPEDRPLLAQAVSSLDMIQARIGVFEQMLFLSRADPEGAGLGIR